MKMKIISIINNDEFEIKINPNTLKFNRGVKYTKDNVLGSSANVNRFDSHEPSNMSFEFILDGSGVGYIKNESVESSIKRLEKVVYNYNGEVHQPNKLKVSWGDYLFKCVIDSLNYEYTLFAETGESIRAKVTISLVNYIPRKEETAKKNQSSPDMSHVVLLKEGESIPYWCNTIYGDASYCTDVARYNGLDSFRNVKPGTRLLFPPIIRNG